MGVFNEEQEALAIQLLTEIIEAYHDKSKLSVWEISVRDCAKEILGYESF